MSTDRDVTTRIVRSWLHEDAHEDADRILNLVLDEIDTTPQRSPSWLARRFPPVNINLMRVALVAAVVVVAVIIGANLLRQPSVGPSPSVEPSPTSLTYSEDTQALAAGRYSIAPGTKTPAKLTFSMPAGWEVQSLEFSKDPEEPQALKLATYVVTHVYTDACAAEGDFELSPIGSAVDDLIAALEALGGAEVSPSVDTTVGGYGGKRVDIAAPAESELASCRMPFVQVWANSSETDFFVVPPDTTVSVYVIDVDGETLAIIAGHPTAAVASDVAELATIIASIEIEPPPQ